MNDMAEISGVTLPEKASALPDAWVERIFRRMEDRYGSLWEDRYGAFPRHRVMATWSEDLGCMSPGEIAAGMEASKTMKFPPTLPEFIAICRPPIDFMTAFHEAQRNQERRDAGKPITWSSKAVYWAFVAFGGNDIRQATWTRDKARWISAMEAIISDERDGGLPEIPAAILALPTPGKSSIDTDEARIRIGAAAKSIAAKKDPKAWARRILENPKTYPDISRKFAQEALGVSA